MTPWSQVEANPDIELVTRQAMLEHGHPDVPALTGFTMYLSDDDGPQLAIRVLDIGNAARLIRTLAPRSLEVICGRGEDESALLTDIQTLICNGATLH